MGATEERRKKAFFPIHLDYIDWDTITLLHHDYIPVFNCRSLPFGLKPHNECSASNESCLMRFQVFRAKLWQNLGKKD